MTNLSHPLEYLEQGLIVGTLSSTFILILTLSMAYFLKSRSSALQMKFFFRIQTSLILFVFLGSFMLATMLDSEFIADCLNSLSPNKSSMGIFHFLTLGWLLVAGTLFVRDGINTSFFLFKNKSFLPVEDTLVQNQLQETLSQLNIKQDIDLLVTFENTSPYVLGFLKYKLILPQNVLNTLSTNELKSILAHELIHIRDRDSLWLSLELLGRRLMFYNPLIYILSEKYQITIEKAADEEAIKKAGASPSDLLQSLMHIIHLSKNNKPSPVALNASRNFREIKERMESLAKISHSNSSSRIYRVTALFSALISLGVSAAQAQLTLESLNKKNSFVGMTCAELKYEKTIESCLNIGPTPNKCEK